MDCDGFVMKHQREEREEVEAEHCRSNASTSDVTLFHAALRVRVYIGCTNLKYVDKDFIRYVIL